jgi:hypothetical protein
MRRKIAILAISAFALVPVFMVTAPRASATYIQGCVHWNEDKGPFGSFGIDAYNRCNGVTIRRRPNVINGQDGACKKMIPNHHYSWDLWAWPSNPLGSQLYGWDWC